MKIAFFTDCYLDVTGGIVTSINAQKTALEKDGHEVYVFTTGFPRDRHQRQSLADKQIYQVPSCKLFFRGLAPVSRRPKIIERWLLRNYPGIKDFDIFYVHYEAGASIAGLRLGKQLGIPTVQVMHGREDMGENGVIPFGLRTIVAMTLNWLHSWYLPHSVKIHKDDYLANTLAKAKMWSLMVNHANYADYVITPSAHFRDKLIHYGVKRAIKVIPNGFPDDKFPTNPPIRKLDNDEILRIIWHSRVSGEKRMMPFLEMLRGFRGQYVLDVYGSGPELPKAKLFAKTHRMAVKFHGDTSFDKVQVAIQRAHLDVFVSYNYDTFGMVLIEAEAAGTPVFICDPDMKEIVPRGSYILSQSESPADMSAALVDLLKHPEKIQKMSKVMFEHRHEILISNRISELERFFKQIVRDN